MNLKLVTKLENKAPLDYHPMVVIDHKIYVIDGDNIYSMDIPYETIWAKMGKILGVIK